MKNKRLIGIIATLAVLVAGSLIYSSMNKPEAKNEKKVAKVGVLQFVSHPSLDLIYKGIQDGLAEEGYKDDQLKIDFMNSEGDQSKVATMSKQLVANGNDLVVGIATPAAQGLASATKDLPVIMAAITDPIGANLVKDLKKPGGNITGVSDHNPAQQQVELIKALTPNVKTIGALYSSSEDNSKTQVEEFKAYAEKAGLTVETFAVPSTNEIASTVNVMTSKVDAIWIPIDNTIASAFSTVVSSNQSAKKPIYPSATAMVEAGGLASVVVDQHDLGVATGKMIAQVLKGAKPAETPVNVMTSKVDAIWVPIDNTIASAFSTVVSSNQTAKKPIYPSATAMVEAGGLASVVVDQHDLGVATGKMIAKVLKGEKPADTPVNVFSTGKSVINKKLAQELGITIPESVLKEAGQVIE